MQGYFSQIVDRMSGRQAGNHLFSSAQAGVPPKKREVSDPFIEKEGNPNPPPENQVGSLSESLLRKESKKNIQEAEQRPVHDNLLPQSSFEEPFGKADNHNKISADTDEHRHFPEIDRKDSKRNNTREATHQEFREAKIFRVEKVEKTFINNPEPNFRKGNTPGAEEIQQAGPDSPFRAAPTIPLIPRQREVPAKREAADSKGKSDSLLQLMEKRLLAAHEKHSSELFSLGHEGASAPPPMPPGRQPQQKKVVIGSMKIEVLSPQATFKTTNQKSQRQNSKPGVRSWESSGRLKLRYGFGQM